MVLAVKDAVFEIGGRVRKLREQRRWTQAELARQLGLSQPRLSQIERGDGSFTAEQFLRILELFNVGVDHFAPIRSVAPSAVQNALARHGASHLVEAEVSVPAELDDPAELVARVLRAPESPRHVAALAPVIVAHADDLNLDEVAARLGPGRVRRLGWLVESVLGALAEDHPPTGRDRLQTQRARLVLELFLASGGVGLPAVSDTLDVFDREIRSLKSAERVFEEAAEEARRWRIVTRLRTEDFTAALRAARDAR